MKKFFRMILAAGMSALTFFSIPVEDVSAGEKIIFIPHDSRPISNKQTAEVVRKLGYEVLTPPIEFLGDRDNFGEPDKLWQWLEDNSANARAAVISSDAMIYGSLVASRKHQLDEKTISERIDRFEKFHKDHPLVKMFTFASVMRTPRDGASSGTEEPEYYRQYGAQIFRYTSLVDKKETENLTKQERKEFKQLQKTIPQEALEDWNRRREKNYNANKKLIDMTRENVFGYLLLGRDDNAPYSQTHMEGRHLVEYASDIGPTRAQSIAGIDEIASVMLTRAVNIMTGSMPFVYTRYNIGTGADTIPAYSDEKISSSISKVIIAAAGYEIDHPDGADVVLLVNTNPDGSTYESMNAVPGNYGQIREGTLEFADLVSKYVGDGYQVSVADIAFANGSDNAMMNQLRDRGLLFKLRGYAGWNTPTNSTGFVLSEAMLATKMNYWDVDEMLIDRYLDEWAYQSNIRRLLSNQMNGFRYWKAGIEDIEPQLEQRATSLMNRFIDENLPPFDFGTVQVKFPWHRMFEADVIRS